MLLTRREPDFGGGQMPNPLDLLVCFAVKEEADFFDCQAGASLRYEELITGMGRTNAANGIRAALAQCQPRLVLTCGFAGGLNPSLELGDIIFDEDAGADLSDTLLQLGAKPGKFHCARRVAITIGEKAALRAETGADVVEMESSVIRNLCREQRIPSATVRVISDTAHEDLPLDFNALMTPHDNKINYPRLAFTVLTSPHKIPRLIEFQRRTRTAAKRLAEVLTALLRAKAEA